MLRAISRIPIGRDDESVSLSSSTTAVIVGLFALVLTLTSLVVAGPPDHLLRAARARVALPLQGLRAALSLQDRPLRPP